MTKEEKFYKERDLMLAKDSVPELEKFFKKWNKELYLSFKDTTPLTKRATLCKMICANPKFKGTELEKKSSDWLKRANMKLRVRIKNNNEPCDNKFLENDWLGK